MRKNNRLRALIVAVFICSLGQPALAAAPVHEIKTPGGLTAWLVEEHSVPLVAVKIAFRESGFAYDAPELMGEASLTSQLLGEGAGDLTDAAFTRALEDNAIRLRFSTDEDLFSGAMETLSEKKDRAFELMGLALTQPRFDADA